MPAIETTRLTRRFGDVVAVDDLSLTVDRGETFGFLGPNGAGKSTTINMLLGFLEPSAGTATVLDEDVTTDPAAVRRRVGLLPEGYDVYENLTGREHVRSAIESKGAGDDPDAIIERVGLDPADARRPAGEYSKGMTQRLFLGIALVGAPELLILDEPASGLDPTGIRLLREIVAEEVDRGATVFFSSHDLDQVERVCDRVGIMQAGELIAVNSVEDLRSELGVGAIVEATVEAVPDTAPIAAVDGVIDVAADDTTVRMTCRGPEVKMAALAAVADRATVTDVTIEEPSLEAIFEEYTTDGADTAGAAGDTETETQRQPQAQAQAQAETTAGPTETAPTGGD